MFQAETWAIRSPKPRTMAGAIPHILIVDDDRQIRTMLARYLGDHSIAVTVVADGTEMLRKFETGGFDLVILDVMLPGEDGFSLCQKLRQSSTVPIILLTARGAETDRVVGLEIGADDYVAKPFPPRELLARIRALLRRSSMDREHPNFRAGTVFVFADWTLDTSRRTLISPDGALVDLTSGEYDLLTAFVRYPQRVLSRDQLQDLTHGRSSYHIDRSIDVQVSRLRRKLERAPQADALIRTIRNGGYYFAVEVEGCRS